MTHPGVEAIRGYLADVHLLDGPIDEQRAAMAALTVDAPAPEGVTVETTVLGGRPAEWLVPDGAGRAAAVLYLHGGGYCSGSLDSHRGLAGRVARAADRAVVSLDYRLAPEHPFPAAIHDVLAAYHQLLDSGIEPGGVAVAGDSAGGGLALAALLALRAEGTALPAAAVCLSPWVDLTQTSPSYERIGKGDPMVTKEGLDGLAAAYLAGTDPRDGLASPLFAQDLSGLPPLRIEVGELEVLADDATRLAEAARAAGVATTLVEWPGLFHVFQAFPATIIPESDESVAGIGRFLATHLSTDRREDPITAEGPA
jgi:epsilon-lactone hydrolase